MIYSNSNEGSKLKITHWSKERKKSCPLAK